MRRQTCRAYLRCPIFPFKKAAVRHETDIGKAAILRIVAVIPHDENRARRHRRLWILAARLLEDIVLIQHLVIDVDTPILDLDRIPLRRDDALDEIAFLIARIFEHEDLTLLRVTHAVNELINDKTFLRLQGRAHRRTIHDVKLDDELADEECQHHGNDDRNDPVFCFLS